MKWMRAVDIPGSSYSFACRTKVRGLEGTDRMRQVLFYVNQERMTVELQCLLAQLVDRQ